MEIYLVKVFKKVDFKFDSHLVKYAQVVEICPIM
jgi:hypothetical protein